MAAWQQEPGMRIPKISTALSWGPQAAVDWEKVSGGMGPQTKGQSPGLVVAGRHLQ